MSRFWDMGYALSASEADPLAAKLPALVFLTDQVCALCATPPFRIRPRKNWARVVLVPGIGDDVFQRLVVDHALHLLTDELKGPFHELRRRPCHMRRKKQVGSAPERMPCGQWFGVGYIERSTQVMVRERLHQSVRLNDGASCGVDEQSAFFHQREFALADEATRLVRKRNDDHHDICLGKKFVKVGDGADFGILLGRTC